MTAKFTPGPWSVVIENERPCEPAIKSGDWYVATIYEHAGDGDTSANAALIAAALELYAALEILAAYPLAEFNKDGKPDDHSLFGANDWMLKVCHVRAARAALAKARGEA